MVIEIPQENEKKARAFLVGEPGNDLKELESLITTLGMELAGKITLARQKKTAIYGIGTGKAHEINEAAHESQSDCIIFDFTIDPTKQRNWERLAKIPVFDRQEVILRIFAQRAQTREAVLQVELARLEYSRPRLAHVYGDLARQRGGNYGTKGSGETQLELDQRQVRQKIQVLKKELEKVAKNRSIQRKRREKFQIPLCSIAGYTNAGKSSLLNALTGAQVLAENKLFATLDPTTRKLTLSEKKQVLLSDTVGFISNLPHGLVNAFKSTLEEVQKADLILLVVDAGDPQSENHYKTCLKVLDEIGASQTPHLIVLNKMDRFSEKSKNEKNDAFQTDGTSGTLGTSENPGTFADNAIILSNLAKNFPDAIKISVRTGEGLEDLKKAIEDRLFGSKKSFARQQQKKSGFMFQDKVSG